MTDCGCAELREEVARLERLLIDERMIRWDLMTGVNLRLDRLEGRQPLAPVAPLRPVRRDEAGGDG